MKRINQKGFTLAEIVVILGVIAILIAILTPTILKYVEEARLRRAESDVKAIAGAIVNLMRDTGEYPGDKAASGMVYMSTDGNVPTSGGVLGLAAASSSNVEALSDHLLTNGKAYNSTGRFRWQGPYLNELKPDPWGHKYLVNVADIKGNNTNPVFVISAGPDGVIDTTSSTATSPSDDDIGVRIK